MEFARNRVCMRWLDSVTKKLLKMVINGFSVTRNLKNILIYILLYQLKYITVKKILLDTFLVSIKTDHMESTPMFFYSKLFFFYLDKIRMRQINRKL